MGKLCHGKEDYDDDDDDDDDMPLGKRNMARVCWQILRQFDDARIAVRKDQFLGGPLDLVLSLLVLNAGNQGMIHNNS